MMTSSATRIPRKTIRGGQLNPNAGIASDYYKSIRQLIERLAKDAKRELKAAYTSDAALDDSPVSQSRIAINRLLNKWNPVFNKWAKTYTDKMIERTLRNASNTLGMSLREMSQELTINTDIIDGPLQEIIKASTEEAANLIRLIPQQFLGRVQGAVMRSITQGRGLQDLVPTMNKFYHQQVRHARNVAYDQTRKSYNNINAGKMKALGVRKFEWVHSAGGQHPRKLHQELNGGIFDLDDPPYIGTMYGERIYGKPGDLPNCKCTMRPIISFEE